jgi:hypothetical protein
MSKKNSREIRDELKKEYLRGLNQAEQMQREYCSTVLGVIKDRLIRTIKISDSLEEAEIEIKKIIRLIDEYTDSETTSIDLSIIEDDDDIVDEIDEAEDDDDYVSLLDFIEDK